MDSVLSLPEEVAPLFGRTPLKAAHRLHALSLFEDLRRILPFETRERFVRASA